MAYVQLMISGNTDFGGYLSIDGQKAFAIGHDVTYELSPGKHTFTVYTASNAERNSNAIYNWGKSGGSKAVATIFDPVMKGAEGESWNFSASLEEKDCAVLTVTTKGTSFVKEPVLEVCKLSEEEYQRYKECFEEMRTTPRQNKKQLWWGIGVAAACAYCVINYISQGMPDGIAPLLVILGGVAVGVLLFIRGFQKRVRG